MICRIKEYGKYTSHCNYNTWFRNKTLSFNKRVLQAQTTNFKIILYNILGFAHGKSGTFIEGNKFRGEFDSSHMDFVPLTIYKFWNLGMCMYTYAHICIYMHTH